MKKCKIPDGMPLLMDFQRLVYDEHAQLTITLEANTVQIYSICFEWCHTFRMIDEGDLFVSFRSQDIIGLFPWPILEVQDSDYIKWFHQVSSNIHSSEMMNHFFVSTNNEIIEVVSSVSPQITKLSLTCPR